MVRRARLEVDSNIKMAQLLHEYIATLPNIRKTKTRRRPRHAPPRPAPPLATWRSLPQILNRLTPPGTPHSAPTTCPHPNGRRCRGPPCSAHWPVGRRGDTVRCRSAGPSPTHLELAGARMPLTGNTAVYCSRKTLHGTASDTGRCRCRNFVRRSQQEQTIVMVMLRSWV